MAKKYLYANQEAIENIYQIIKDENIDCDFERQDSYVYTNNLDELEKIKLENEAVNSLGFNSEFVTSTPLPFDVLGAIKFPNQAEFNPIKYAYGLADAIIQNSGKIYTDTLVTNIQKEDDKFITSCKDYVVKSKYVILASHYPFIDRLGYYFLKMYQSTSYVIAVDIGNKSFDGMYINSEQPTFSYRFVPFSGYGGKRLLLVGGADHKTGSKIDLSNAYKILEDEVRKYYPDCKVLYKWNTEDCITLDKIPYIGEFSHFMPNMYIGTGFNKWGMTSSNVGANIIVDKILGRENEYENVFTATRLHPIKNNAELGNMIKETANSLVINKFKVAEVGTGEEDLLDVGVSGDDNTDDIGYDGGLDEATLNNYGLSGNKKSNGDLGNANLSSCKEKDDEGSDVGNLGEDGFNNGKSGKDSSCGVSSDDIGESKKDSSTSDKEYVAGNEKYSNKDDTEGEKNAVFYGNKNGSVPVAEKIFTDIENDTGHVLEYKGQKIGVYKDTNGRIFTVKPICTHLGCLLSWNNLDKTWDCPCHGSRFDYMGHQLYNPAIRNLNMLELINDI